MIVLMVLGPITLILCITGIYLIAFLRVAETFLGRIATPFLLNTAIALVLVGIPMIFGIPEFYSRLDNYLGAYVRLWMIWTFWSAHVWVPLMALVILVLEILKRYRQTP